MGRTTKTGKSQTNFRRAPAEFLSILVVARFSLVGCFSHVLKLRFNAVQHGKTYWFDVLFDLYKDFAPVWVAFS